MSNLKVVWDKPSPEDRINSIADAIVELQSQQKEIQREIDTLKEKMIETVGIKDEGSQSFHTEQYLITTTQGFTRSVDAQEARRLLDVVGEQVHDNVFDYKPSLNLRNYRALKELNPDLCSYIDQAITTKPNKPSVKVEVKGE